MVTVDRDEMHAALCAALGIHPGHGSQRQVAEAVGTRATWYNRVRLGEGTLDTISDWCNTVGVRVVVEDHRARFEVISREGE